MIATSAAYPAFCATCIRSDVELELTEIDGRWYQLCAGCRVAEVEPVRSDTVSGPGTPQRVERVLRRGGGATINEILLALGCPGDNKEADGVRTAIRRLRQRGIVEAEGPVDTRGLAVYRIARGR